MPGETDSTAGATGGSTAGATGGPTASTTDVYKRALYVSALPNHVKEVDLLLKFGDIATPENVLISRGPASTEAFIICKDIMEVHAMLMLNETLLGEAIVMAEAEAKQEDDIQVLLKGQLTINTPPSGNIADLAVESIQGIIKSLTVADQGRVLTALKSELLPMPQLHTQPHTSTPQKLHVTSSKPAFLPPDCHSIIVETRDKPTTPKIHTFSATEPLPKSEVDFRTWSYQVKDMLHNMLHTASEKRSMILSSLKGNPLVLVHQECQTSSAREIFDFLDGVYGIKQDALDLFRHFLSIKQDDKESPLDLLVRLNEALRDAQTYGAVQLEDMGRHLLKQFTEGCVDESLISRLRLHEKSRLGESMDFRSLHTAIREDGLQQARRKLNQLNGKKTASSAAQQLTSQVPPDVSTSLAQIQKQLQDFQKAVEAQRQVFHKQQQMIDELKAASPFTPTPTPPTPRGRQHNLSHAAIAPSTPSRPFNGFCFRCGTDGHRMENCTNEPDYERVVQRMRQRYASKGRGRGQGRSGNGNLQQQ